MSEKALSFPEISALLILMTEAGEVSNPLLKERYGLTIAGKERRTLNELKLVESWKEGRAFVHVLTDGGWVRVAEEIRAGVKTPTGSAGAACRALLAGLQRFLDRTDQRYADLFTPYGDSAPAPVPASAPLAEPAPAPAAAQPEPASPPPAHQLAPVSATAVPATAVPAAPASAVDLEARIRAAYLQLAGGPGSSVSFARLRPLLGDVDRVAVDAVLTLMNRAGDVWIDPASDQKSLSEEERKAAVVIGDQDKHSIKIEVR